MDNSPPLDLAAQLTLIQWNVGEDTTDSLAVNAIIQQALAMGGIKDLSTLTLLKSKGLSVFGQVPSYPRASDSDIASLINQINQFFQNLEIVSVPTGAAVNYNADEWAPVTTTASTLTFDDVRYSPPLT